MDLDKIKQKQYDKIIENLKIKGLRLTDVRRAIINVIIAMNHPTAADIIRELETEFTAVNTMSVYNTLDLLLGEHILFANTFNGKQICYELVTEKSVHLKCDKCGSIKHLEESDLSKIQMPIFEEIVKLKGMTVDHFKIEVHGTCAECSKK